MNRVRIPGRSPVTAFAVTAAITCCVSTAVAQTAPGTPAPGTTRPAASKPAATPKPAPAPKPPAAAPAAPGPAGTPATAANSADGEEIIARVGATSLSAGAVRSYLATLSPRDQLAVAKDPALLSQAVRLMLANRLLLQEAQSKNYEQQPAVAAQLEQVRENALIELYLQSLTTPPSNFPSDDEVQKAYETAKGQLVVPRQFQLAQVFIAVPKDADKAAQDRAKQHIDELAGKLKAPNADFTAIATAESKDGGEAAWLTEPQVRPELRTQVAAMAANGVTDPIRLDDGWHIVKILDTKASYTRPLAEVREQIVQQMRAERAGALRRAYLADLQRLHPPVVNELALSKIYENAPK